MLDKFLIFLEAAERTKARFILKTALRYGGVKVASFVFVRYPFIRRTTARTIWFQKLVAEKAGRASAAQLAINYLSNRPRSQLYLPLLNGEGSIYVDHHLININFDRLIYGTRNRGDAFQALCFSLIQLGEVELALKATNWFKRNADNRVISKVERGLRAIVPRPLSYGSFESKNVPIQDSLLFNECNHRLVIIDGDVPPTAIYNIARGAKKLTLIKYGDLYGKFDIDAIRALISDEIEINVEHARSRAGRFERRYHDLHLETYDCAKSVISTFIENSSRLNRVINLDQETEQSLVLQISDNLFYKALRLNAIFTAVEDKSFDSVVVSFGSSFELYRALYSRAEMINDRRIVCGCWSSNVSIRSKFEGRIANIHHLAVKERLHWHTYQNWEEPSIPDTNLLLPVSRYLSDVSTGISYRSSRKGKAEKRLAFVVSANSAYLRGAVEVALQLQKAYSVDIIWTHGSRSKLSNEIEKQSTSLLSIAKDENEPWGHLATPPDVIDHNVLKAPAEIGNDFKRYFLGVIKSKIEDMYADADIDHVVKTALDCELSNTLSFDVLRNLVRRCAADKLLRAEQYDALILCPPREPRNALFTGSARQMKIPSISLETHCLNAAYCRYGSISSDFAIVSTEYFRREYEENFGICADRAFAVGSPRLHRPKNYASNEARKRARGKINAELSFGDAPTVLLPTQPLPRKIQKELFKTLVKTIREVGQDIKLIVKIHPEENESDASIYREIIQSEGASGICKLVDYDIKDLIAYSNVVAAYYSVTALEAAILDRSVLIIGRQSLDYPMPYDKILGVPFCSSEAQLKIALMKSIDIWHHDQPNTIEFRNKNTQLYNGRFYDNLIDTIENSVIGNASLRPASDLPKTPFVSAEFTEFFV